MKFKVTQIVLSVLLLLLILLAVSYKYCEFKFFDDTAKLYNLTSSQELKLNEKMNNESNKAAPINRSFFVASSSADLIKVYYEVQSAMSINSVNYNEYISVLTNNKGKYQKLKNRYSLIIGKKADLTRNIIDKQTEYYNLETQGAEESLIKLYFWQSLYEAIVDMSRANQYDKDNQYNTKENTIKNFPNISSLNKYSSDNFKFNHEDQIAKLYPDELAILNKYKLYFASYYDLIKSYIAGQQQTTSYTDRWNKMRQNASNINLDWTSIFKNSLDRDSKRGINIATIGTSELKLMYEFESMKVKYPLLSSPTHFSSSVQHCQLYDYKASIYPYLLKKPISANSYEDLLIELSSIPPSTIDIDKKLDISNIEFINDKIQLQFVCVDQLTKEKFTFTHLK